MKDEITVNSIEKASRLTRRVGAWLRARKAATHTKNGLYRRLMEKE